MNSTQLGRRAGTTRKRILVVDDNPDAARTVAALLDAMGHEVLTAGDGAAALDLARRRPPDVVLLDIGMPVMDGYQLAAKLREEFGARPRLIALTFQGQDADLAKSRAAGIDQHLLKPIDPVFLQSLLG